MAITTFRAALGGGLVLLACGLGPASAQMLKFSYPVARDNPMGLTIEHFAGLVSEATEGAVTVRGFPDATLGNEIQSVTAAQGGAIEMAVTSTAGIAGTFPDFDLFNLPFNIRDDATLDRAMKGAAAQQMLAGMEDKGLHGLCMWDYGFRNITNNKHAVTTLADLSGLRIRTIQNSVYLETISALGANPAPLAFPETFSALETGAIDGNEIANAVTRSTSFYEVQDHLAETRHFPTPAVVMVSGKAWGAMTPEQQAAMTSACEAAAVFNREVSTEMAAETDAFLKEQGMAFSEIGPEALAEMRDAVAPVAEKVTARLDPALVAAFQADVEGATQ